MDIRVRVAQPADWQIIQKLNHEVITSNMPYDEFLQGDYAFSPPAEKYYRQATSDMTFVCLIAEHDGKPVGYVAGSSKAISYRIKKTIELNDMGVTESYRSRGVGAKLVSEFARVARDRGFQSVYVNAYYKNEGAIEFYKKQGFRPIDVSLELHLD